MRRTIHKPSRGKRRGRSLRPVEVWVPDVQAPGFAAEARRQSLAVAASAQARTDQAFIDAVADPDA